jgi:hypothetical protein
MKTKIKKIVMSYVRETVLHGITQNCIKQDKFEEMINELTKLFKDEK